jgi:hypothetical protein
MTKKKKNSGLPSDRTPTMSSNHGLDGFFHNMSYGDGKDQGYDNHDLAESRSQTSGLPRAAADEKVFFDSPMMPLDDLVGRHDPVSDLSWLGDFEPDPERLPENPVDKGIEELNEAWSRYKNSSTRVPLSERVEEVKEDSPYPDDPFDTYHVPMPDSGSVGFKELGEWSAEKQKVRDQNLYRYALGLAHNGRNMDQIRADLKKLYCLNDGYFHQRWWGESIAPLLDKFEVAFKDILPLMNELVAHSEAFPKCASGQGKARVAKEVKYVLKKNACNGCVHAKNNSCQVFHKPLVAKVEWKDLVTAGQKVAKARGWVWQEGTTSKSALLDTFRKKQASTSNSNLKTIVKDAADTISEPAARIHLQKMAREQCLVQERVKKLSFDRVAITIKDMVTKGHLTQKQAQILLSQEEGLTPQQVLVLAERRANHNLTQKSKKKAVHIDRDRYEGVGVGQRVLEGKREQIDKKAVEQSLLDGRLEKLVKSSDITESQADFVRQKNASLKQSFQFLDAIVLHNRKKKTSIPIPAIEKSAYQDASYQDHRSRDRKVAQKGVSTADKNRAKQAFLQLLNQGLTGKSLYDTTRQKLASSVRQTVADDIQTLRATHEGLAGELYVIASAYDLSEGCAEGSSLHKESSVPYVLSMRKCGSCVFKNAHGECNKYKKPLVARDDFEAIDLVSYQKSRLKAAYEKNKTATQAGVVVEDPVLSYELSNHNLDNFDYFAPPESSNEDVHFGAALEWDDE